jgi:hypothetical protein
MDDVPEALTLFPQDGYIQMDAGGVAPSRTALHAIAATIFEIGLQTVRRGIACESPAGSCPPAPWNQQSISGVWRDAGVCDARWSGSRRLRAAARRCCGSRPPRSGSR